MHRIRLDRPLQQAILGLLRTLLPLSIPLLMAIRLRLPLQVVLPTPMEVLATEIILHVLLGILEKRLLMYAGLDVSCHSRGSWSSSLLRQILGKVRSLLSLYLHREFGCPALALPLKPHGLVFYVTCFYDTIHDLGSVTFNNIPNGSSSY